MDTSTATRHPRKTREQWQALVKQFDESELSAGEFCEQHNISHPSLTKWRSVFNGQKREQESHFVELTPNQQSTSPADDTWSVELAIGQHIVLRIR